MKKKRIDDYIGIAKTDIWFYTFLTLVFFFCLLYLGYKVNFYYIILIDIIMLFATSSRIYTYYNLRKIKKYLVNHNLLDKIGNIDFWNEKDYFLTDNYMIIKKDNDIYAFTYNDIKEMYVEINLNLNSKNSNYSEYLHIVLDSEEFRILIYTTILINEEYRNITDYLLNKNPNIKVLETVKNNHIDIFRIS